MSGSGAAMAEHMSQSELDYPFKLLEYVNGFRVSKVTIEINQNLHFALNQALFAAALLIN